MCFAVHGCVTLSEIQEHRYPWKRTIRVCVYLIASVLLRAQRPTLLPYTMGCLVNKRHSNQEYTGPREYGRLSPTLHDPAAHGSRRLSLRRKAGSNGLKKKIRSVRMENLENYVYNSLIEHTAEWAFITGLQAESSRWPSISSLTNFFGIQNPSLPRNSYLDRVVWKETGVGPCCVFLAPC